MGQAGLHPGPALEISGTPLRRDEPARGVRISVTVSTPTRVRLWVSDFEGRVVRKLYEGDRRAGELVVRWKGRDAAGRRVAVGAYRVELAATPLDEVVIADDAHADAWVTVARQPIHPVDPGAISVVIDPGHGGAFDGALGPDGTREADLDLDIGLRVARMLEGAGVRVILTRDTDSEVDTPPIDRTFDGVVDVTDDLAARADLANAARADLFIAVHNNLAVDTTTGGPSTYYSDARTFAGRSRLLARIIQAHMVEALASAGPDGWRPYDHGALTYPYYVLRGYDPPRLLRPTQMPAVLSEGLFLSNPRELRLLQRPRVRQAMANAYYEAIAEYLERRGSHVGYSLVRGPTAATTGGPVDLEVEVRDQGTTALRGWRLVVGAQPAASESLARARPGRRLGERRIPVLRRGERRTLRIRLTAPCEPGEWVLLVDALDATGARASRAGSPMLQVPLITTPGTGPVPPGSASPCPIPTATSSPSP